jgi:hypothetical protein
MKENTTIAFLTNPIWFVVSPIPHLYKLLPSLNISNNNNNNNNNELIIIIMD